MAFAGLEGIWASRKAGGSGGGKSVLYCWGDGSCGQLGLGEEEAAASAPFRRGPELAAGGHHEVRLVACGERHTLLLFTDGTVASCGDNALGQLGRRLLEGRQRSYVPEPIQIQGAQNIVHVSCGKEHSLAICNNGKVFSWGAGTFGQLGTGELRERIIPKKIDGLSTLKVIQVACGNYHSIALAKDGRVFSWGQNTHGQLGLGKEVSSRATPQHVPALDGIPLAQVSAGGAHSFALSLSGVAYGWGRNHAHQLGLSPTPTREQVFKPMSVAALRSLDVTYISCGDEHTAVLTENGSIFTFGDDSAGQLGHSSSAQKTGPQKVDWIDGPVSQLACGSYHTLVLSASGQLISFGRGPLQRYGSGTSPSKPYNTQSFNISSLISPNELSSVQVKCIFAGTYVSFASMCPSQTPTCANRTVSCVESLLKISQVDRVLIDKWMSAGAESEMRQTAKRNRSNIFFPILLNSKFLKPRSALELGCCIAVDLQKAGEVFKELTQKDWIAGRVCYSLLNHLIPALPLNSPHQEALSSFLLLPECSAALEAQNLKSLAMPFAKAISSMSKRSLEILEKYWLLLPDSTFDRVVQMLKRAVISQLPYYLAHPHCLEVVPVLEVLKKLYKVNKKANYKLQISNFYINEILKKVGLEDLRRWYIWIEKSLPVPEDKYPVSFCRFPFVFDPQSKMWIFYWSSHFQQEANARQALLSNRLQSSGEAPKLPVFLLRVQRHNLVESTLRKLSRVEDSCLRCQLMVEFEGEMARHEAGGVLLEFFWYLFEEMTHPEYGMFMYCEHNSPMWFPAKPSVEMNKYFLFGLLCGLFLFNRVFVYVPFPLAAFKKLTGQKPSLDDLKELSPVLGKSLQAVLDYEHDDIEEKLQLCYSISWDNLDIDLIPNGSSVAVNNTNKKDFVNKYVDYILNKSVNGVFEEFKRGFYKVLDKRIVGFFEPQELMEVAIGNEKYDWDKLEKNTVYWGVYSAEHPTIKMFWEVFHELTLDDKKGFLLFVRGSDRIPVTGMDSEKITIHSHRLLTEDHIPEAQTCFSILFLPPYSTKGKLKEKFLQAIENNRGFGKQ